GGRCGRWAGERMRESRTVCALSPPDFSCTSRSPSRCRSYCSLLPHWRVATRPHDSLSCPEGSGRSTPSSRGATDHNHQYHRMSTAVWRNAPLVGAGLPPEAIVPAELIRVLVISSLVS